MTKSTFTSDPDGRKASSDYMKYLILVGAVTGLMTYIYGNISYQNPEYSQWDLNDYRAMAQAAPGLTNHVREPFIFRILGPYLVGLLPLSIDSSFLILSISSGLGLSILLYSYLSANIVQPPIAALGSILFVLNKYLYGFPSWNYFQVCDNLSQIEVVLLMWTMTRRNWLPFGIILFLGSLTKEIPLVMIPVAVVYLVEMNIRDNSWRLVLSAVLPACLTAIVLRIVLHSDTGNNLTQAMIAYAGKLIVPETWFRLLINSFLPFSLLPIIFADSTRNYFRTRRYAIVYFILVMISTFFGYNNERLMAPTFIIFYSLLAIIIEDYVAQSKLMVMAVIFAAVASSFHHTYARFPLPRGVTIAISLFAFLFVSLIMIYYRIQLAAKPEQPVAKNL